jgi:hypothetical protein
MCPRADLDGAHKKYLAPDGYRAIPALIDTANLGTGLR